MLSRVRGAGVVGMGALALVALVRPLPAASAARAASAVGAPVSRGAAALPLTVVQVSDTALTLDSNNPTGAGPHAMYVSYRVTNTSGASVANLSATLSGFTASIYLAGGQAATQYLGTIPAGQSRTLYWFVGYASTIGTRAVLAVDVTDGAGGTATGSGPVRTVSMISAQAGGLTSSASIGAGAVIGQLIDLDVFFQFKGWGSGDTFNLQPAGNITFPGGCFQLVSSVVLSVDANLSSVIVPGTANLSFFKATVSSSGGGSTWNASIRYTFRYLCAGTTATPLPYSNEMSGGQLKYSANYGSAAAQPPTPIPAAPPPGTSFTFTKTAALPQMPAGGTQTYTIAIRNNSTFNVTVDEIRDTLPAGVAYVGVTAASGVTAANSSAMPAANATGPVTWRGVPGSSYAIAPGATLSLQYTATVTSAAGQYRNSAAGLVGPTPIGAGAAITTVGTADLAVYKTGPATRAKSDTVKYQVATTNRGPTTAFQVVVRDTLPAGVTFVRATNGGTFAAGVVTWPARASLAVGAATQDSVVILAPNTLATLLNVGAAASASYDPVATNNDGSADSSRVSTTLTLEVNVSPKGLGAPLDRLPSNAVRYSQPFTVSNVSVFNAAYHLIAARAGSPLFLAIDSITGAGITTHPRPDSALVSVAANSAGVYTVWYTIPVGDTLTNVEVLRARHTTQPTIADTGWVAIHRTFPSMTLSKTVSPAGVVSPGVDLTYTMRFKNGGTYDASSVVVSDAVPPGVWFRIGSTTATLTDGITTTASYSNDDGATWVYTPVSGGCGAPAGHDGCVNRLRWTLSAVLPPNATQSVVTFMARIR